MSVTYRQWIYQSFIWFSKIGFWSLFLLYFLRYAATFEFRMFGSVQYKISICIKKFHLDETVDRAISFKFFFHFFISSNIGLAFIISRYSPFPNFQLHAIIKFWNKFCCIVFLFATAKKNSARFFKFYFKPKISIFLSHCVSLESFWFK